MKKRLISVVLALCLCVSALPNTYALQEEPLLQEELPADEPEAGAIPYEGADDLTYQSVYDALIAMQAKYPDGTDWTNDTPYYDGNLYHWKGGPLGGQNISAAGCAAFAFELSDAAFGDLPARMYAAGQFTFTDVKAGDILRINNDTHTVIVLRVSEAGVVIAEGNYNSKVLWGRTLLKTEVEAASHYITRYPEGYFDPDAPTADKVIVQGTAGGLTWKLTKAGTLTISGVGAMPDFAGPSDQPWNSGANIVQKIIVEDGVTSIGSSAFYNSTALSIAIPRSVTAIGDNAFYGSALIAVSIPDGVEAIGNSAFRSCANLGSVSISEGVESIGENAFRGCQKLPSITLPASVGSIGAGAFYDCVKLESAVFVPGSGPVTMGSDLFARCWELRTVTLPLKIDRISDGMFQNCYMALSQLDIPQGAADIGGSAFASCSSLNAITIPDSVTAIGTAAFAGCGSLKDIYFSGSEAQWNSIAKTADVTTALQNVTIHCSGAGSDTNPDPGTDPAPSHTHSWAAEWSSSTTHHWHDCTASGCTVTDNSQKDGCGPHLYDSGTDITCNICGYIRTISGSSSPGGGSSSGGSGSSITSIVKNPDGSITTKTENKNTGTITETTKNPDGSQTMVKTQKDGTVTIVKTDSSGSKTETVNRPDGSSTTNVTRKDGTAAAITTDVSGQTEAEVTLPAAAVSGAQSGGGTVTLPIPAVQASRSAASAPVIAVKTGSKAPVKVEILVENVTPGTVAALVTADGSVKVVMDTVPTEDGITVSLPDGAVVKIMDNSKSFTDVPASHWASSAVNFISARELSSGTAAAAFDPEAPMTRAMMMTVLARYDGEDTGGGAVWYEKGMNWSVAEAISDGSSPDANITREQLVTMLWRYAGSPTVSGTLSAFTDVGEVSGYAREAMRWAVEKGIIQGVGSGRLDSKAPATRAQAAAMLMLYISNA